MGGVTQRDRAHKWIFYTLLSLLWAFCQQLVLNHLALWGGVHPFVLPLLPVLVATMERRQSASFFAVAAGLLCDFLMPGIIPCFYTLAFLAASLVAGQIAGRIIMPGYLCAFVCAVFGMAITGLMQTFFSTYTLTFLWRDAFALLGRELLLTLPLTPLVFCTLRWVRRTFAE